MIAEVLVGDCRESLRPFPDGHFHCCVTSPPYWGLRDYGLPPVVWGGDAECEHEWDEMIVPAANGMVNSEMQGDTLSGRSATRKPRTSSLCAKCGAWRGCLGLEPTPEFYIEHLVSVFREVWRVLRDDGTLWLNLGDSFASGKGTCYNPGGGNGSLGKERKDAGAHPLDRGNKSTLAASHLKPKDLVGIPWRVAFALQADGWYLRRDVIWQKPQPMPESVRDRCTTAHEYIFMLTKRERYWYDAEAVAEPAGTNAHGRGNGINPKAQPEGLGIRQNVGFSAAITAVVSSRNRRSVWTIPSEPFRGQHFATYPTRIPALCLLAGSPERCCPECGAGWERVMERKAMVIRRSAWGLGAGTRTATSGTMVSAPEARTAGWRPSCSCYDERYRAEFARPRSSRKRRQQDLGDYRWGRVRRRPGRDDWPTEKGRVLDPFAGAGSTLVAAARHGRDSVGCEMSESYAEMARERVAPVTAQGRLEL